ncbi:MAG: hypothetical protein O3B13_06305 [Planctomycetota bacterium]|nr:hypothetical protein [Planctomycetota bacterium]
MRVTSPTDADVRWTTQSPLGFEAGDTNLFRYVGNSPTNATDPSGLQEFPLKPKLSGEIPGWRMEPALPTGQFLLADTRDEPDTIRDPIAAAIVINFIPNRDTVDSEQFDFIQIVRTTYKDTGQFFDPSKGRDSRNTVIRARTQRNEIVTSLNGADYDGDGKSDPVRSDFWIDVNPKRFPDGKPTPFYNEAVDPKFSGGYSGFCTTNDGSQTWRRASLMDSPGLSRDEMRAVIFEFETVAVDRNTGVTLGAIQWGFTATPAGGDVKFQPFPTVVSQQPSRTFEAALSRFLQQVGGDATPFERARLPRR